VSSHADGDEEKAPVLSDEDLAAAGFEQFRGWKRRKRGRSRAASRKARHRAKQRADGFRQINLVCPADERARTALRALADALTRGAASAEDILAFAAAEKGSRPPLTPEGRRVLNVLERGGWRAAAIRWLAR